MRETRVIERYSKAVAAGHTHRKKNLGELAVQEIMTDFALLSKAPTGIFLFEDHKIASTNFMLPANCHKISTRAFLQFLDQRGWLESAAEIERRAIQAGRVFSKLRFPQHFQE